MSRPPPTPIYTLRTFKAEDITALCFIAAEENLHLTKDEVPSLLTGSSSGEISIWNLMNFRVQHKLSAHKGKGIISLFLGGDYIFSHGRDGCINSWIYSEESWIINRTFPSAEIGFCSAHMMTQNSNLYLIIPHEKFLNIVDYESSNIISQIHFHSHGMCMCMKVKSYGDDTYVFCGYEDGFITVWSYQRQLEISEFQSENQTIFCIDVDLLHRHRGVSGTPEGPLEVWNISEDFQLTIHHQISLTNPGVNAVAIRPDGKIMISGGCDGSIRVYNWKSFKLLAVLLQETSVSCLSYSNCTDEIRKKKSVFATGSRDGTVPLWSIY